MSTLSYTKKMSEISTIVLLPKVDRHLQTDFCQFSHPKNPPKKRLEEIPFVAIDPRPDPEE